MEHKTRPVRSPEAETTLTHGSSAPDLTRLLKFLREQDGPSNRLFLIQRVELRTGLLKIELKGKRLVDLFGCESTNINPLALIIQAPFRMRRPEVELKLHLGEAPPEIDKPLVQNVVKAGKWLDLIIESKTFSDLADCEGVSMRRVQDVVNLALLALDILKKISVGEQPCGLTTHYLIKRG